MAGARPFVLIGSDTTRHLIRFCESTGMRKILLVADGNTYPAAGEELERSLRGHGFQVKSVMLKSDQVVADAHHILQVLLASDGPDRTFLAVGSGTITDITRFVSHRTGSSFIAVPTAPSVDGFASMGAPLIVAGVKTTANAHAPVAIFADLAVLSAAPHRLIAAGFGDMLGKYTSVADWRLGHLLWDEPYDEAIARRSVLAVESCARNVEAIGARSREGVRSLMEALIESGLCMLDFGGSLPASGSEHHYSHFWEMKLLREGRPAVLHGAKVGVATVLVADQYEKIRELPLERVSSLLNASRPPPHDEEVLRIRAAYGSMADEITSSQAPFIDMGEEEYDRLKRKILDRWTEIQEIARQVPGPDRIMGLLEAAGGPTDVRGLGLSAEDQELAAGGSHYLRAIFTVSKLMRILFPDGRGV